MSEILFKHYVGFRSVYIEIAEIVVIVKIEMKWKSRVTESKKSKKRRERDKVLVLVSWRACLTDVTLQTDRQSDLCTQ